MNPEDVARLFDDRPGFNLVDFEEVGLPVYRLTSIVLTLQTKAYSPIEEFVLRSIDSGLTTVDELSGFLGISTTIIEATASNLIRDDELIAEPDGTLRLTRKSEAVLSGERHIRPREQSLVFRYDGLTRRPIASEESRFWEPRDLRERGIREIRPFPPKRPNPQDIRGDELQAVLPRQSQSSEQYVQVLQVKSISRAAANFIPAVALIYRRASGSDVQVGFSIDGRLSREHEDAFAASDGPTRMGITASILKSQSSEEGLGVTATVKVPTIEAYGAQAARQKAFANLRRQIEAKDGNTSEKNTSEPSTLTRPEVEMIAVYDHPPLLHAALKESQRRLIIISPWITDAVVDRPFLQELAKRLEGGLNVYIGYGLGQEERIPDAVKRLEKLSASYTNFCFVRLGDTHAKVLIKDDDWLVTTSFNWLSFRGDPKRTFREEWGTRVAIREQVVEYAQKILNRFNVAEQSNK